MGLLSWFMRVPKAGSHASLEDPVPCGKSNRSLEFLQESVRHTRFHPASEPLRQIISSEVRHIISKATIRGCEILHEHLSPQMIDAPKPILMPSFNSITTSASIVQSVPCASQLRTIGFAIRFE